jgi:CRP/FNR family cyclic AMP-dependent transcriptional regulator
MPLNAAPTDVASLLAGVSLFAGLSAEDLEVIAASASRKRYRRHTVVMEKGDESSSLYVLLSGKVKVYICDREGKELVLNVLEPGAHLGELALLGGIGRTASVMTQEDSEFLVISKQDFVNCLAKNPQLNLDLIRHLVEQIQTLTERVGTLVLCDVYGRLSSTLKDLAREEDGRLITGRLTQQDLARMVGSSREMVSRIFTELKKGGYIEIENKRIILNKTLPARW